MAAKVLDGKKIARDIQRDITARVTTRNESGLATPGLAILLVGDDPASVLYVRLKQGDCKRTRIECTVRQLPAETSEEALIQIIEQLNQQSTVDGILLQLPLPDHIDAMHVVDHIDPRKDVDGVTPRSLGKLTLGEPAHRCCTPQGVMTLLESTEIQLRGKHAVVIGASIHVGKPMIQELLLKDCTVTVVHIHTTNASEIVRLGDIVISATGVGHLVKKEWIKPGAVVVDVGIEPQPDGSLLGDVDYDEVSQIASWITPVPGGVGPMTRVSILKNLLNSAEYADREGLR